MKRKRQTSHRPHARFTKSEIEEMEKLFLKAEESFDKNFYEMLAKRINVASSRSTKRALQWKQIQRWFQDKQSNHRQEGRENAFLIVAKELISVPEVNVSVKSSKNGSNVPAGVSVDCILELEARSSTDGAWYDVDTIPSYKYTDSGGLEALVHYQDFSSDEDEWVNVKNAIRERSIPIDSTECQTVSVGDHVVCYWERDDRACHFDAHVLNIQRKKHDIRGCRCCFLVQYDHDKSEETVTLERVCRRP